MVPLPASATSMPAASISSAVSLMAPCCSSCGSALPLRSSEPDSKPFSADIDGKVAIARTHCDNAGIKLARAIPASRATIKSDKRPNIPLLLPGGGSEAKKAQSVGRDEDSCPGIGQDRHPQRCHAE